MILKIKNIKNFGVFKNFDGSNLSDFKTLNLIYGWNYSGKTTLSRVFRCLEKNELHKDYLPATFELKSVTDKYDNTFAARPNIRVFNSDFIKDNLKWDTENIEPILLLGEVNIELQKSLADNEQILKKLEEEHSKAKEIKDAKEARINSALTNKAREITTILSLGRTFERDKLKQLVEKIQTDTFRYTLNPLDFEKFKIQAISTEQKPEIQQINLTILSLATLKSDVETVLYRQAASDSKIQKLLDNKKLSDWVEHGKELHEEKADCEFCGNRLPTDLFERLNQHFSKDYDELIKTIDAKAQQMNNARIMLTGSLPTEVAFYKDINIDFVACKSNLELAIKVTSYKSI